MLDDPERVARTILNFTADAEHHHDPRPPGGEVRRPVRARRASASRAEEATVTASSASQSWSHTLTPTSGGHWYGDCGRAHRALRGGT